MRLNAALDSKVVDGSIVATVQVNASGGIGHRRAAELTFINTVNDNSSSMVVKGEGGEFGIAVKCIEACINPFFGEGYHRYKAEVTSVRNGTTSTVVVSNYVVAKPV